MRDETPTPAPSYLPAVFGLLGLLLGLAISAATRDERDDAACTAALARARTAPDTVLAVTANPNCARHVREVDDAGERVRRSRMPNTSGEVAP